MFASKKRSLFIDFGIPYFDVFDPRYKDIPIPTAVRGSFSIEIKNFKKFAKTNGFANNDLKKAENAIRNVAIQCVKGAIANLPFERKIPVWHMERKIDEVSSLLFKTVADRLKTGFNITLTSFNLTAIEPDAFSDGYKKLAHITQGPLIEGLKHSIAHPPQAGDTSNPKMQLLVFGGIGLAFVAVALVLFYLFL